MRTIDVTAAHLDAAITASLDTFDVNGPRPRVCFCVIAAALEATYPGETVEQAGFDFFKLRSREGPRYLDVVSERRARALATAFDQAVAHVTRDGMAREAAFAPVRAMLPVRLVVVDRLTYHYTPQTLQELEDAHRGERIE